MCGISGIVFFKEDERLHRHIFKMNDILQHRGSDDEGYAFFSDNSTDEYYGDRTPKNVVEALSQLNHKTNFNSKNSSVALSHNRLSIIDISEKGHQPMSDISQRYWITFNGEIYNYTTVRDELKQLGHTFLSNTDTEVVLLAFKQWGAECVQKFNGMWALAIYDRSKQTLFLSRDRFGVKPLYYRLEDNYLCFASEQKALYHIEGCNNQLNRQAIFHYLSMGLVEALDEGFVQNIFEVKPAHNITIDVASKAITKKKYYHLSYTNEWTTFEKTKANEHIQQLEILIKQSVERRLQSDVQVGSCLSGGIDSSVVVGFVNQLLNEGSAKSIGQQQKVFTSCFKNDVVDEEKWAKLVVDSTQTEWHKTYPSSEDFVKDFKDIVYHQDVPFFSASTYAQYRVMQLAHGQGIKVTLDGQGADELFAGYAEFYSSYLCNAFTHFDVRSLAKNFDVSYISLPLKFSLAKFLPQSILANQFKKANKEFSYINHSFWNEHKSELYRLNCNFNSKLNSFLHYHLTGEKFKNLLRTADRNSMRFSVESRMPFADDIELIEYIFKVSASYKIRNKTTKYLLREAAKRILPKAIYERKDKIGFAAPEQRWFKEQANQLLEFIPNENDEFVNWKDVRANWDALVNNAQQTSTTKLWRLLNFAVWRKVHQL
jgi:asparagine synthase (glutamine-hydrolysing)